MCAFFIGMLCEMSKGRIRVEKMWALVGNKASINKCNKRGISFGRILKDKWTGSQVCNWFLCQVLFTKNSNQKCVLKTR